MMPVRALFVLGRRTALSSRRRLWICGAPLLALLSAGCGPSLIHVGYAAPDKVWYHFADGNDHVLVVCDVRPDGSETNCRESKM